MADPFGCEIATSNPPQHCTLPYGHEGPHEWVWTVPRTKEHVVVSETGGMKGQKPIRLSEIDPIALQVLGAVGGMGADKYERGNYLRGYDWSLCMDALYRHFLLFQAGEDLDPESGLPHMGHVAWHALALVSFLVRGVGTDDRHAAHTPFEVIERN